MSLGHARAARRWWRAALTAALVSLAPAAARAQGIDCDGTPGEREVRSLEFRGNRVFSGRDLALRVSTTASDFLQRRLHAFGTRRCLDSDALRLDVGRLRVFYQRHGYDLVAVHRDAVTRARALKPAIPEILDGIPVRHELELEVLL